MACLILYVSLFQHYELKHRNYLLKLVDVFVLFMFVPCTGCGDKTCNLTGGAETFVYDFIVKQHDASKREAWKTSGVIKRVASNFVLELLFLHNGNYDVCSSHRTQNDSQDSGNWLHRVYQDPHCWSVIFQLYLCSTVTYFKCLVIIHRRSR